MNTSKEADLLHLFARHFPNPEKALGMLFERAKEVDLPFGDILSQTRSLSFPAISDRHFEPIPFIYYFVPQTGWGTSNPSPADPVDQSFAYQVDGIGFNFGCPVRLARALEVLFMLPGHKQRETRHALKNSKTHLATIEELLWATYWRNIFSVYRGSTLVGAKGDVDWRVHADMIYHLEAKFRPTDWPRITDGNAFQPHTGSFLNKALHKFPQKRESGSLHVVGITLFEIMNERIIALIGDELGSAQNIDAVVIRTLSQFTYIISYNQVIVEQVLNALRIPELAEYPINYFVNFDRFERAKRLASRPNGERFKPSPIGLVVRELAPNLQYPAVPDEIGHWRLSKDESGPFKEPIFTALAENPTIHTYHSHRPPKDLYLKLLRYSVEFSPHQRFGS